MADGIVDLFSRKSGLTDQEVMILTEQSVITLEFRRWNQGNGSRPTHTYFSNGSYIVSLIVTDNEGKNGTDRTSIYIVTLAMHKIPAPQVTLINARYNLMLSEQFSCYDSDGNGIVDTFVDPNHILTAVHNRPVTLSNNIVFSFR